MSVKPDYYEVLGVAKTATVDEIKKAHHKIAIRCHPDAVRHKQGMTDKEKDEAVQKFKWATEALEILSDARKREVYDRLGHKGLERYLENGGGTSSSTVVDETSIKKIIRTPEDAFDYFDRISERNKSAGSATEEPRVSGEERRRRSAEERARRREEERRQGQGQSSVDKICDTFDEAAEKIGQTAAHLKDIADSVTVPVESLQRLVHHLQKLVDEANNVIREANNVVHDVKKRPNPDHKPKP